MMANIMPEILHLCYESTSNDRQYTILLISNIDRIKYTGLFVNIRVASFHFYG